jgi:hypothetical protein
MRGISIIDDGAIRRGALLLCEIKGLPPAIHVRLPGKQVEVESLSRNWVEEDQGEERGDLKFEI